MGIGFPFLSQRIFRENSKSHPNSERHQSHIRPDIR